MLLKADIFPSQIATPTIQVVCNSTKPCRKWHNAICIERIVCYQKYCNQVEKLTERHLKPKGILRDKYENGEKVEVECNEGYYLKNGKDSIYVTCHYTDWYYILRELKQQIPSCSKYSDCIITQERNNIMNYKDAHQENGLYIIKHGETTT